MQRINMKSTTLVSAMIDTPPNYFMLRVVTRQILVFKTDILAGEEEGWVRFLLDNKPEILQWNFDHADIDHVLRVVTCCLYPRDIEVMLREEGFFCEELPD